MGSVGNKYRVHEVAKDFGVPTKQITEILTKYAETPKNHMQVLGDRELSLIFESLTQHNQVFRHPGDLRRCRQACREEAAARRQAAAREEAGSRKRNPSRRRKPVSRVPQTKVVDTRKATAVNMDKYDEKLQDMAGGPHRQQPPGPAPDPGQGERNEGGPAQRPPNQQGGGGGGPGCAACGWRSSKDPPSPCRSPMRSAWASWPAA